MAVLEEQLLQSTHVGVRKLALGLVPRLIAAGWFGLAALAPVGFFFLKDVGEWREIPCQAWLRSLWIFAEVPIAAAALLGFLLGAPIMNTKRAWTGPLRGLAILSLAYPLLMAWFSLDYFLSDDPETYFGIKSGPEILLLVAEVGAIYTGWLIVIAGIGAGVLLFRLFNSPSRRERWIDSNQVGRGRAAFLCAVAIIIYLAQGLLPICFEIGKRACGLFYP